ncbi:MAG TPA: hypothetical protein VER03_05055 [Bryobacteraceae bacterium]|nr:hypothetical protein [Bryobacteraceae bacterium]
MWNAVASGLAGATAVTLMNETIRQFDEEAPRLDLLGMRALAEVVSPDNLRTKALVGDLASNTLYYSMVAAAPPEQAPLCGATLGFGAGLAAVLLPGPMGLGDDATNRSTKTRVLSVAYYTTAGLLAGIVAQALRKKN